MKKFYGRKNDDDTVTITYKNGELVDRLPEDTHPIIWPIDSGLSAYNDHTNGLRISMSDAKILELGLYN